MKILITFFSFLAIKSIVCCNVDPCVCYKQEKIVICRNVDYIPQIPSIIREISISSSEVQSLNLEKIANIQRLGVSDNINYPCPEMIKIRNSGINIIGRDNETCLESCK